LHVLAERQKTQTQERLLGSLADVLWEQAKPDPDQADARIIFGYTPDYQRVALHLPDDRQLDNTITPVRIMALAHGQNHLLAEA